MCTCEDVTWRDVNTVSIPENWEKRETASLQRKTRKVEKELVRPMDGSNSIMGTTKVESLSDSKVDDAAARYAYDEWLVYGTAGGGGGGRGGPLSSIGMAELSWA
jgi:hypothetical protein